MTRTCALGMVLAACASGAGPRMAPSEPLSAIVNATAIPMDTARLIPNATIIVRGDTVAWIGATSDATIPPNADRVDARGAFVLPGLADLHVHTNERHMPPFLRNGVTTIRELNGSPE